MSKLGIYFGPEKQDALFRGDTSNAVVNRYFVYGFLAIGTHFCEVLDESPAMVQLQARYLQGAWESFIETYRTDKRLAAQGILLILHSLVIMGFPIIVLAYVPKLYELIDSGDLRFLPVYGRPLELSDQVREDSAVLSQAIYLENYLYLALDGPAPTKTTRIEREFRRDLQVRIIRWLSVSRWTQRPGPGSVSSTVRSVSVDHADPKYTADQGRNHRPGLRCH